MVQEKQISSPFEEGGGRGIFPKDFFWGAATSAHQVEGGNQNDWSMWEKENAKQLSRVSGGKYPPENYISGQACDHYNRYTEDFDIAKQLGHNAHRFSIEWSRVEPEEGKFDEKEIEHYRNVIAALRLRGMEPFVTLWHWTNPVWFVKVGGWTSAKSVEWFLRYAVRMVETFPDVRFWITLNETNVYTGKGYWRDAWPPGEHSFFRYLTANHHFSLAHKRAYAAIKRVRPDVNVGVAHSCIYFSKNSLKSFAWNRLFLSSIRDHQDFIGVNYYHSDRKTERHSEFLDWPIDPKGLYYVLREVSRFQKPIYITENGIADARDIQRAEFIKEHIRWMKKAMDEGIDIRGYLYWSLLDNFEWDKGFWPRFGLVEVNYKTLERTIRPSVWEYKKIIEEGL